MTKTISRIVSGVPAAVFALAFLASPAVAFGQERVGTALSGTAASSSAFSGTAVSGAAVSGTAVSDPAVSGTAGSGAADSTDLTVSFKPGLGAAVDTLDIQDERLKIVLRDDNTWYYIKNLDVVAKDDVFTDHWTENVVNPYADVELTSLPLRSTLILDDGISRWACPNRTRVFSKFGYRHGRRHQGVDLPYPTGTPVPAAFDGRVRASMWYSGYGNIIIIRHENGLETYYGHLSKRNVEAGDWVHAGDIIGLGGSTGRSTGPHLHFETRYKGYAFDPEWIADYESGELRQNVFVLKRTYLNVASKYVPETMDEEEDIYLEEQKILEEEQRRAAEQAAMRWHTVRSGETVSAIAHKNGKTIAQIKALNPKLNVDRISVGQKIRVN